MSNNNFTFTRDQLAQFLPDQRSIKSFEAIVKMVNETTPDSLNTILALIGSGQAPNINQYVKRIEELENIQLKQKNAVSSLVKRIEELEAIVSKQQNLDRINKRLDSLEAFTGV
jgi:uncharacterized coiled-coil protein SlyX